MAWRRVGSCVVYISIDNRSIVPMCWARPDLAAKKKSRRVELIYFAARDVGQFSSPSRIESELAVNCRAWTHN